MTRQPYICDARLLTKPRLWCRDWGKAFSCVVAKPRCVMSCSTSLVSRSNPSAMLEAGLVSDSVDDEADGIRWHLFNALLNHMVSMP